MKNMLIKMSKYDKCVNENLYSILKEFDSEILNKDFGSKYKSVNGLLFHMLDAYGYISKHLINKLQLEKKYFNLEDYDSSSLDSIFEGIHKINDLYIDILTNISNDDLYQEITSRSGNKGLSAYFYFYQIFNHATHHRGAIQLILELNGYDKDFSGVIQNYNIKKF